MQDPLFNQSLEKGLGVLLAFSAKRPTMTLADVAEAAQISKSSAQRMIYTLEQLGYIRKHAQTRRYQLTPRVMQLGFNYIAADALIEMATPFLSELARATGESCSLTEPDGTDMVYVSRFVTSKFMPIHLPIGSRIPMYCTASGRAFLSALPEHEARVILERSERIARTEYTTTSVDEILGLLREARRRGYATNVEELYLGDMTIGVPVIGAQGLPVGSVHVVAPTSRWSPAEVQQRLAPATLECARAICNSVRALR